ncbi:hypothetical protein IQ247_19255 [Plectonema cf. radiosum LEGE 06105]|uniref:Uncharacterized protein n=1 Tax=Plectonema cf. radiosum LEGE 06105 TaxID=945769 RepID=A0A8J7FJ74_9CYAN|nr:hypothetical protein [Plectonema radiosum]MBE9214781.1 hypothetical protein [Plectonema cf. radiosum LEGE 06105]
MLRRLIQWLKKFFQRLFGTKQQNTSHKHNSPTSPPPPLNDTDLEFLFTELLEGVHQARGQAWAQKWLENIEHRVPQQRWVEWLQKFGDKLLAASTPNNELASRLVQLGELGVGPVSNVAYDIGMRLLTRNEVEPIWEYAGPDAPIQNTVAQSRFTEERPSAQAPVPLTQQEQVEQTASETEGEYQTITVEELMELIQDDVDLRSQIAQQLGIETDDPQVIIQTLVNQYNVAR